MKKLFLCLLLLFAHCYAQDEEIYDVIVVGGGASGAYCAWRLSEHAQDTSLSSLCLFEASERIGGRLYSVRLPEMPDSIAEFGGMRFTEKNEHVRALVDYLKLPVEPFRMATRENFYFLRGEKFKIDQINKIVVPYNLKPHEKGKNDTELLLYAMHQAFPELKNLSEHEFKKFTQTALYKGKPLWQWGFWNFLMSELSMEAYRFIDDTFGFRSVMSNWNAYDALNDVWEDIHTEQFFKLSNGYDSLPKEMTQRFFENGGKVKLNSRVTAIKKNDDSLTVEYNENGSTKQCIAKHVILALPRRSIEMLDPSSFMFEHPNFVTDLQRVSPKSSSKIFVWYDTEWWTPLKLFSGASKTDLPIRQCFYWDTDKASSGMLMASYNDGEAVEFWQGFLKESALDFAKIKIYRAPESFISQLARQLSTMHRLNTPLPQAAYFINWSDDPYGAAWHYWNPYNQSWVVSARIRHPISNANLYICGEAYSSRQGWVEGAVNTAENLLQQYFALPRAAWIPPNYDLGP